MSTFSLFKDVDYVEGRGFHGIAIRINEESHDDWISDSTNTFSLEGLSDALLQYDLETDLELLAYDELEEQEFLQFCQLLKEHLPAVTSLTDDTYADSRMAKVLECFPNLVKLQIYISGGALTYQAIGGLKQLEEIILEDCYDYPPYGHSAHTRDWVMTPECCEILANSLEALPVLRKVKMIHWIFSEARECWWPLVCALGGKPNLELDIPRTGRQYIGDGSPRHPGSSNEYVIDGEQWNILQNGPTWEQKLMEVQRRYNLSPPDGGNIESILEDTNAEIPEVLISRWVETVVALNARNQVDCVKAMMEKVSAIPDERINAWVLAMIEFHQQGQFVCFHMIFDSIKPKWISNRPYWES